MSTADAALPAAIRIEGAAPRVLVVQSPYYREIADGLLHGAERILKQASAIIDVLDVAGALELPQAIEIAARRGAAYDAYVALGCVIRGETDHYDHVCRTAMSGLMDVALRHGLATGNGLLTVHTRAQAEARARHDGHNKGAEAAAAALGLVVVRRRGPDQGKQV